MCQLVGRAVFPALPGVYVVHRAGQERPLYVGVAATQTIAERWRKQHLCPRAGGSALRRSLGVYLALVVRFLKSCEVEFFPTPTADEADDLEPELRQQLNPD